MKAEINEVIKNALEGSCISIDETVGHTRLIDALPAMGERPDIEIILTCKYEGYVLETFIPAYFDLTKLFSGQNVDPEKIIDTFGATFR